jgi:hypothetical protein
VCLDKRNHDIGSALATALTLIEHGVGLTHPWGRAEIDP